MLIRKSWWNEVVGNIELSLNAWLLFNYLNKWNYFNKGSATRKFRCCKGCVVVVAVFCLDSQDDALLRLPTEMGVGNYLFIEIIYYDEWKSFIIVTTLATNTVAVMFL